MKIMVRADDLGYSRGVNYGIYDTVKNGVIKNIGFMVNMPDSVEGYELVDYSLVIAPVVADLCTTPVALSAPPNSYQNNSQS